MKILKKTTILIGLVLAFLVMGCDNDNQGLPDSISLSENGGTTYLNTKRPIAMFEISISGNKWSSDFEYDEESTDSVITRLEWLTVKARIGEKKFKIIADNRITENDVLEIHLDQTPWDTNSEAIVKVKRSR